MKSKWLLLLLSAVALASPCPGHATWLLEGNVGVGMPQGDFGDYWDSGLLVGASVGYLSAPFEIGADLNFLSNDPSDSYSEEDLEPFDATAEFSFVQYGVHARWMPATQGSLGPYLGVGLAAYDLKEEVESPLFGSQEFSNTSLGVNFKGGANFWLGPAFGLGADVTYHLVWPDEEEIGHDNASFLGLQAGLRYKLGAPSAP
ncbi:MAG TPA: outer membrane beta-barrel protein [Candidatus Eisenbacteria bacterium]|nr:outer membrane beta-barrel protein [Candidatus Eisenbacteria bacterium]